MKSLLELRDHLNGFLRVAIESGFPALTAAVTLFKDRERVRRILQESLNDREYLSGVVSDSYVHPNGFDKIVLISSEDPQYKLRLHVWWSQPDSPEMEDVHNHRWDFGTVLLSGGYQYEQFERSDTGERFHEYSYVSPDGSDAYTMNLIGTASLSCKLSCYMPLGSTYVLSREVLHRVTNQAAGTTATLMLQGPTRRKETDVFKKRALPRARMEIPLQRFDIEMLRSKFSRLLTTL